jgi:hypothetical protein
VYRLPIVLTALVLGCGSEHGTTIQWTEVYSVGVLEGPESLVFGEIRDLAIDKEGRVYVLDGQAKQLRVFGPNGSFITQTGRLGEGPGEFREPFDLEWAGDGSLLVYDPANQRITRYAEGTLDRLGEWRTDLQGWEICVDGEQIVGLEARNGYRVHRYEVVEGVLSSISSVSAPHSDNPLLADYEIMSKLDCGGGMDGVVFGSELYLTVEFVDPEGRSSMARMPPDLEHIVIESAEDASVRVGLREDGPGYFHWITGLFQDGEAALVSIHSESREGLEPDGTVWRVRPEEDAEMVGAIPFVPMARRGDLFAGVVRDPFPRVILSRASGM